MRAVARWAGVAVAAALAVITVEMTRSRSGSALEAPSTAGAAVVILPCLALVVVGAITWGRRLESVVAASLVGAGLAWALADWSSPAAPGAVGFTAGLIVSLGFVPALAAAVARHPDTSPDRGVVALRAVLAAGFVAAVGLAGALPAVLSDPRAAGCVDCPADLVSVARSDVLATRVAQAGAWVTAACGLAVVVLLAVDSLTRPPSRRRTGSGVLVTGSVALVLGAAVLGRLAVQSFAVDDTTRRLRTAEGVAVLTLAAAMIWSASRPRRLRRRLARLVLDLAVAPPPGGLRDSLAETLGDPSLVLGYHLSDGRVVDSNGRDVEADTSATPLVLAGRQVAVLTHQPGLLDDPTLSREVAATARLALDNELLHAELAAQLEHLRASRQRIVEAADQARRRLERDLHDGAQQHLVGLLLRLRLERMRRSTDPDPEAGRAVIEVEAELARAVDELRELARGVFPPALAEEGLVAALEDLTETAGVDVRLVSEPGWRAPAAVESACYFVVCEALRRSAARSASVRLGSWQETVCLELCLRDTHAPADPSVADGWLVALEDRVGAVNGDLVVATDGGELLVRAVIPCAS